jgi:hypothetical protein
MNPIQRLERRRLALLGRGPPDPKERAFWRARNPRGVESFWVPHREEYHEVLDFLRPDDVLCDMGAGDARMAWLASRRCRKVYAVEISPLVLKGAFRLIRWEIPPNLVLVLADWNVFPVPADVTVVSCLVRIPWSSLPTAWAEGRRAVLHGDYNHGVCDIREDLLSGGASSSGR